LLARLLDPQYEYEVTILKRSFSDTSRISTLMSQVSSFDLDKVPLNEVFDGAGYDIILHCATDYGRKATPRSDVIESNLLLPLRLLETGLNHGVRTFINTDTMLDKNVSDYTLSKRQFREWLQSASNQVAGINMVLEHFYGPGDDSSKFVAHIIRSLVRGVATIPLTAGRQKRDFIYVDDVVDAFLCVIEKTCDQGNGYLEYEVGSGVTISVKELVTLAKSISGNQVTQLDFGAIPYRSNEPMDVKVDASQLHALGWRVRCDLPDGLLRTIDFERGGL
jgi:nucleoside-diphosphate-sugar epimerase